MPTTVNKTVGTSSRDYSNLIAAEAAIPANIVSSDEIWKFTCYADSVFTDFNWRIAGITSDATRYVEFTVVSADRHTGTRGTGLILRSTGGAAADHSVEINIGNFRLFYFEIDGVNNAVNSGHILTSGTMTAGDKSYIANNLIYDNDVGANNYGMNIAGGVSGSNFVTYIYGNTVLGNGGYGISTGFNQTTLIYNNTVVDNNTANSVNRAGINPQNTAGGIYTIINNISMNNGTTNKVDIAPYADTTETNMTSDATGEIINKTASDQFVSAASGSEDVHLLTGSDAKYTGTDISTLGVTPDILTDADGETRGPSGNNFSVGAYEFPDAGGDPVTVMPEHSFSRGFSKGFSRGF